MHKLIIYCLCYFIIYSCNNDSDNQQEYKDSVRTDSFAKTQEQLLHPVSFHPSKKESELYDKYFHLLGRKSIKIQSYLGNIPVTLGCSFLVRKRNKIFLVTNYHLVTGLIAMDTLKSMFINPKLPDSIKIYFHSKDSSKVSIPNMYPLYTNGKRNFFGVSRINGVMLTNSKNEVFDLIFFPLDLNKLNKDILIDTISLSDKSIETNKGDLISIWGYNTDTLKNDYCSIDTGIITKPTLEGGFIAENGIHLYSTIHKELDGDSGSPVYMHIKDKIYFVGIHTGRLYDKFNRGVLPEFADGSRNQFTGHLLSRYFIKISLENSTPN